MKINLSGQLLKYIHGKMMLYKVYLYRYVYSTCENLEVNGTLNQPVLFEGSGDIRIGRGCSIGYYPSPYYYNTYAHMDVRSGAKLVIGDDCFINNGFVAIASTASIYIGNDCLIGANVELMSSDFHNLEPEHRRGSSKVPNSGDINIGRNVFLGSGVKVLKGVTIGENSVIAAGSVVVKNVDSNSIVGGNPAKLIRSLKN